MFIAHYGIKGQRWGIRRYQNDDGTLTPEGRIRYGVQGNERSAKEAKDIQKELNRYRTATKLNPSSYARNKFREKENKLRENAEKRGYKITRETSAKAIAAGAAVTSAALTVGNIALSKISKAAYTTGISETDVLVSANAGLIVGNGVILGVKQVLGNVNRYKVSDD